MLRAYRLADYPHLEPELTYLYNSFRKVGFPKYINRVHSRVKRNFFRVQPHQDDDNGTDDSQPTICIPHNKFVSDYIRPVITGNGFRLVHSASNSLRNHLVTNKPPRPATLPSSQSAGVYRLPCSGCDRSYYGETGRSIDVRVGEHRSAMRKGDLKNACFKHFAATNHSIDFDNCQVVFQSENWYNRLVVESSCIVNLPNFKNMRSTLAIDKLSANIVLSSCPNTQL